MTVCCCHPNGQATQRDTPGECPTGYCYWDNTLVGDCSSSLCQQNSPCACCFGTDCVDIPSLTFADCIAAGGTVACPQFCSLIDCNDWIEDEEMRACCLPDGNCQVLTRPQCQALQGEYRENDETCDGVECQEIGGCRGINEPRYNPGDKVHSLALCETAIMGFSKRQPEHSQYDDNPKAARGFVEPLTTHETRACRVSGDPCQRHFGALVKEADGYVYPALWSEPFDSERGGGRWNIGAFVKQVGPDPEGRVPAGYVHARVGVENEPWTELVYYSPPQRCAGVS